MKSLLALIVLTALVNVHAGIEVIYGKDNRQDVYQVQNKLHLKLAKSTAAMVPMNLFSKSSNTNFFDLLGVQTLERSQNICPSEKFSEQPAMATCSGFLVGPDTLVTAGHCYKSFSTPEQVCKSFAWVFGLEMKNKNDNPLNNISRNNIYLCKKIIAAELNNNVDFAVIKLSRAVVGREPLKFRTKGKVLNHTSLVVIGHPSGIPTKITSAGKITKNTDKNKFSTNLDTFHGNSGSAVFNSQSGLVEGILIQGKTDYVPSRENDPNSCMVVNKCDELGNSCQGGSDTGPVQWGEVVLRIDQVLPSIYKAFKE